MRRAVPLIVVLSLLLTPTLSGQQKLVYRLSITGEIENGLAPYVARGIREANARGAAAIYLDIDTPGGRIDAAERIADAVRHSTAPVYAFVDPRAYSAGALIALSTKGIYMREGAVLGAATPVDGGGTKLPEKYVSAMRAEFRALAEEQGLNPRIAEAMVDEQLGVPGLADSGKLITLSTAEALKVGFAKARVDDEPALLSALGLAGAQIVAVDVNWAEAVVRFLANPIVSTLLLSLGVLGFMAEVKAGTHGVGLLIGLVAFGLFFGSSLILGLAGMGVIILLGLGLLAIAIEAFVIPGHGFTGVLGLLMVSAAVIMAMLGNHPTSGDVLRAFTVLVSSLVLTASGIFTFVRHLPSSGRFSGLLLKSAGRSSEGFISAPLRNDLIGHDGVALTDLRPSGTVRVGEERIDVITEGEYIPAGSPVRVVRSEGYRLIVRPVA